MQIIIRVRPDYIADPNDYLNYGYAEMKRPDETITLGPFPIIKVIVRAEAHDRYGPLAANMAISAVEKEFQLTFDGDNNVDLNLGDYELNLNSSDPFVVPEKDSLDASIIEEPPTITSRDIEINANLNITTDPSVPVSGREVTFSLIDAPSDVSLFPTTATTDDNGNCKVTLTTAVPNSPITVEGVFKVEWEDPPGTTVVKEYKDQITISPNIMNFLVVTKENDLINIPDFVCDYFENGVNTSIIKAKLRQMDLEHPEPYDFCPTIDGKEVKFTTEDPYSSLSPPTSVTGAGGEPGEASSTLTSTDLAFRDIKVKVEGVEDPADPNFILPAPKNLTVRISDNLVFKEDFEDPDYNPGLRSPDLENVLYTHGWGLSLPDEEPLDSNHNIIPGESVANYSYFDAGGIKLYSNEHTRAYYGDHGYQPLFDFARLSGGVPVGGGYELRFSIRNGTEYIHWMNMQASYRCRGQIVSGGYMMGGELITFFASGDTQSYIWNVNHENIGGYGPDWMNFRIQIIPAGETQSAKIVYLLDKSVINTVDYSSVSSSFEFNSCGGSVWYDNIEVYSLHGLPGK